MGEDMSNGFAVALITGAVLGILLIMLGVL